MKSNCTSTTGDWGGMNG